MPARSGTRAATRARTAAQAGLGQGGPNPPPAPNEGAGNAPIGLIAPVVPGAQHVPAAPVPAAAALPAGQPIPAVADLPAAQPIPPAADLPAPQPVDLTQMRDGLAFALETIGNQADLIRENRQQMSDIAEMLRLRLPVVEDLQEDPQQDQATVNPRHDEINALRARLAQLEEAPAVPPGAVPRPHALDNPEPRTAAINSNLPDYSEKITSGFNRMTTEIKNKCQPHFIPLKDLVDTIKKDADTIIGLVVASLNGNGQVILWQVTDYQHRFFTIEEITEATSGRSADIPLDAISHAAALRTEYRAYRLTHNGQRITMPNSHATLTIREIYDADARTRTLVLVNQDGDETDRKIMNISGSGPSYSSSSTDTDSSHERGHRHTPLSETVLASFTTSQAELNSKSGRDVTSAMHHGLSLAEEKMGITPEQCATWTTLTLQGANDFLDLYLRTVADFATTTKALSQAAAISKHNAPERMIMEYPEAIEALRNLITAFLRVFQLRGDLLDALQALPDRMCSFVLSRAATEPELKTNGFANNCINSILANMMRVMKNPGTTPEEFATMVNTITVHSDSPHYKRVKLELDRDTITEMKTQLQHLEEKKQWQKGKDNTDHRVPRVDNPKKNDTILCMNFYTKRGCSNNRCNRTHKMSPLTTEDKTALRATFVKVNAKYPNKTPLEMDSSKI